MLAMKLQGPNQVEQQGIPPAAESMQSLHIFPWLMTVDATKMIQQATQPTTISNRAWS